MVYGSTKESGLKVTVTDAQVLNLMDYIDNKKQMTKSLFDSYLDFIADHKIVNHLANRDNKTPEEANIKKEKKNGSSLSRNASKGGDERYQKK